MQTGSIVECIDCPNEGDLMLAILYGVILPKKNEAYVIASIVIVEDPPYYDGTRVGLVLVEFQNWQNPFNATKFRELLPPEDADYEEILSKPIEICNI